MVRYKKRYFVVELERPEFVSKERWGLGCSISNTYMEFGLV